MSLFKLDAFNPNRTNNDDQDERLSIEKMQDLLDAVDESEYGLTNNWCVECGCPLRRGEVEDGLCYVCEGEGHIS